MNILEICGYITGIAAAIAIIAKLLTQIHNIIEGIKCQLRSLIVSIYYKYKDVKQLPQYEAENVHKVYSAYKALRGNSFIDELYKDIKDWEVVKDKK